MWSGIHLLGRWGCCAFGSASSVFGPAQSGIYVSLVLAITKTFVIWEKTLLSRGDLVLHPWIDEPTPVLQVPEAKLMSKEGPSFQQFVVVAGFMDIESHFAKVPGPQTIA